MSSGQNWIIAGPSTENRKPSRAKEILLPLRYNDGRKDQEYRDDLIRYFVDVLDTPENRQFFVDFKERLKEKFQRFDIWIITFPVEAL